MIVISTMPAKAVAARSMFRARSSRAGRRMIAIAPLRPSSTTRTAAKAAMMPKEIRPPAASPPIHWATRNTPPSTRAKAGMTQRERR
jgi:hypothetical protein